MSDTESGRLAERVSEQVSVVDDRVISIELLGAVTSLIPDASVITDGAGIIVSANSQAEGLFGYKPETLAGNSIEALVPERARRKHRGHREGFTSDPQSRPMGAGLELTGRRRDGSEFPIDISLAPISSGGQQLVIAAIRDVTEQRRSSEAQAELAAIVQSSFDAIISTTLDGRITNWNPAAAVLLGFAPDDILNEHVSKLMPDEAFPVLEELLEAAVEGRYREAMLTRWRHRDGHEVDASVSIAPLMGQSQNFLGFCYVIRDNTERKKSDDELRRLLKEEEQLQRQHAMTSEIRLALLSDVPLNESLDLICRRAAEFVDATVAVICVKGAEGVRIVAGFGLSPEMLGMILAPGASFAETVIDTGVALELERRSDHSRVDVPETLPDGPTFGVPIAIGGVVTGSLTFVRSCVRPARPASRRRSRYLPRP